MYLHKSIFLPKNTNSQNSRAFSVLFFLQYFSFFFLGNYKLPSDWKDQEISSRDDIVLESCHVTDRCTPNPCEHSGVCKQNSDEFYCECEGTGYTGAVCHTSLNFMSCVQYSHAHPDSRYLCTKL